ncbi:MAG: circadian clock KaiC-like protein [Candidatus Latescibacterota bacterium]|nr:MAG: circadian clock KaiC-like protein [Candidatus Latescibacterota bacterium]
MKTGITFFDEYILKEGFPEGFQILIAGEPGSGKTIFASQIMYNVLSQLKEKGIYVSFAETKNDFYDAMRRLNMDFTKLEEKGVFKFIDLVTVEPSALEEEINLIMQEIISFKPKYVVIDTITTLLQLLGREKVRIFLHTTLGRFVKAVGAVAFLIAEKPYGQDVIGYGVEEFITDGVIVLYCQKLNEILRRTMEIKKLRGRKIKRAQYEFAITENGIVFLEIPDLIMHSEEGTNERVTTGIDKLDEILGGGVFKDSITLIAGMSGTGKTTFGLHFAVANALQGKKVIYLSFEEQVGNLLRAARNYNMPIDNILGKNLEFYSWIPEAQTPVDFFMRIKKLFEKSPPDIFVIDSLTSIRRHMDPVELLKMIRYLQLLFKSNKVTTYMTLNIETEFDSVPYTDASTLTDNIIILKYKTVGNSVKLFLTVIKERASKHSRDIYEYEITPKGIVIK